MSDGAKFGERSAENWGEGGTWPSQYTTREMGVRVAHVPNDRSHGMWGFMYSTWHGSTRLRKWGNWGCWIFDGARSWRCIKCEMRGCVGHMASAVYDLESRIVIGTWLRQYTQTV